MSSPGKFDRKRIRLDATIEQFFGANAAISIVVLLLITIFLFREGAGFFGQNLQNIRLYRLAGLEYVDFMRDEVEGHTALNRSLQDLRVHLLEDLTKKNPDIAKANADLVGFDKFADDFDSSIDNLRSISSDLTDTVTAIKDKATNRENAIQGQKFLMAEGKIEEARKVSIVDIDYAKEVEPVRATFPAYEKASQEFTAKLDGIIAAAPVLPVPKLQATFDKLKKATRAYIATFPATTLKMKNWNQMEPVPWYQSGTSFLFGTRWVTNSFWQDFYGVLPLLAGSLTVSAIALAIGVPLGVCAAVYVSEIATPTEQNFIKPYIEFISAIPSVVLGFFGIAILGEGVKAISHWGILSWIPGFPISSGLNAFTAGALLAIMSIPTIFSLSEDALNSVPRSFKEASYALGANRLQTIVRILMPAALSGIISAVLLGFGRVVGETMVVLLCAGNRIAIPDFTKGLSAIFEPVHTMTGIVAQEMGEVAQGSIHYRALFMVGLLLFLLSLVINWTAQAAVRRFKISIG